MLRIIDNLKPFFEDCYRRVSVREYAKLTGVSPPTASKMLSEYHGEGILVRGTYRNYILFSANKESRLFIAFSRIYWQDRLKGVVEMLERKLTSPAVVLFGSLSKAEAKHDSDIDLAVFATKRELDFDEFEKKLKRKIQAFWFGPVSEIKSRELANSAINGHVLAGRLKL